ncbi:aldehyde dehydrogenase family protein [Trinickia terrae]|uniref:Aldehyde dehydrogenase family protein n=1 Tax=Trinickia terrae TaxID=2571161 RepID=A0A4U1HKS7_9BURK|nr:aldehyde dehydrogenase family protein [Trinickia terrae]TKC80227.1 aldehyde dehydrogenase family protein [Trinickia terrae]
MTIAGLWIDGAWVRSGAIGVSINPSTGKELGQFYDGGHAEAEAAIAAARRAFDNTEWAHDRQLRARALMELADQLEARAEVLISMNARETGKTIPGASLEAHTAPATLRHNAGLALAQRGGASEILPGVFGVSTHEPIGVAGLIIPWNAPLALCVRALGPALAAGCTVVVKMPAQTALTNALIAEALASTKSLPPGVVNLITESGNDCAMRLVESPLVDAINFTGSTRTGKLIAAKAAESLKRVSLELGGKTPLVVFEDTDIDAVAPVAVAAITMFSGQFCMAGSRILVQRSVADAWRTRLAAMLEAVVLGPADDPSSQMGPLIDRASVARVDALVREAASYGRVLVRGGAVVEGALAEGSFFRPAMIEPSRVDVPLVQQEIFGPVLSFETFEDEADAVRLANATDYGLAASVFTRDLDRAQRVVRAIKAGTVWVNGWATLSDSYEEGGFKQSGIGRARGSASLEEFQETKTTIQVVASPGHGKSAAGH